MAYIYQLIHKKAGSYIASTHSRLDQIWPELVARSRSGETDKISVLIRSLGEKTFVLRLLEECEDSQAPARLGIHIRRCPQTMLQYAVPRKGETFEVTTPNGEKILVFNLSRFCRERGLSKGHMCTVAQGRRHKHHGYRITKVWNKTEQPTMTLQPN